EHDVIETSAPRVPDHLGVREIARRVAGSLNDLTGDSSSYLADPQVIWDAGSGRFYYVVLNYEALVANSGSNVLDIGFSKTSSPSSAADFCKYSVDFGYGLDLPDHPKLGDSSDFLLAAVHVLT